MENKHFKPATRFLSILEVHKNTLFTKQYTEKMVGSRAKAGLFAQQLEEAFQRAYTTDLKNYRIHEFALQLTGYFGPTKDPVVFDFTYAYDPYNVRLNLREVKATLRDDYSKTYRIKSHPSRDLPSSGKAYEELVALRNQEKLDEATDHRPTPAKPRKMMH